MNAQINQLVRSLLQKETLDQCSLQELEQFADRHPYFGAAQLLLTKKLQVESPERYDEQLQKTFLFFHNPLWVEHLLNDTGNAVVVPTEKKITPESITPPVSIVENEEPVAFREQETESSVLTTEVLATPDSTVENKEAVVMHEEATEQPVLTTEVILTPASTIEIEAPVAIREEAPEQPVLTTEAILAPASTIENKEPVAIPEEIPDTTAETVNLSQKVEEPALEIPALQTEQPGAASTEMVFEPYYTVDYFASQGIKFKEEEKPTDKFGQQLKSFTDWLKTMKRLPVTEIVKAVEAKSEEKVEQLAEHSLEEREVVTEAMAAVWEKQGNAAKAIEVYSKLSLLDPSKSPYFAAKIDALKKTN